MAVQTEVESELTGETMYERLRNLLDESGEVMVRLDSSEEAELHRHNTTFEDPPMVKVTTGDAVHWFNAEKIESCWIHYDF